MSDERRQRESEPLGDVLQLALVAGVGPRTRAALLAHFGSSAAVLEAPAEALRRVAGVGAALSGRIAAARREIDAEAEIALCRQREIAILTADHDDYPRLLREIHDPPAVLFCRGRLLPQDALCVAIVGTRRASHYGRVQAERLAGGLARAGLTIVSGLARGVDAAAHRGALAAGGRTIAVLGSGILNLYPPEHQQLAEEVARQGALLSEVPPRSPPISGGFPQRNRLISGMSLGVVVVEAADRSGALITARHAMEQGRDVFAVPGRVSDHASRGCHRLLRDGARLVESIDDVLEELGPLVEPAVDAGGRAIRHPAELQLNEQEQAVLAAIGDEPTTIDRATVVSGLPVQRVLATISVLEMRHLIRRLSPMVVVRS